MNLMNRSYSVLIVSASEKFRQNMSSLLNTPLYSPVKQAFSVSEARRMLLEKTFDIVLINTPLPDDFGIGLACDICDNTSTGVILFVKHELYDSVTSKSLEHGVVCISMPTNSALVAQNLKVMCATRERLLRIEHDKLSVEEKIEEIRIVNKAKWLLIEHYKMTEAEAQKFIEKEAMNSRISKKAVAESVIISIDKSKT